MKKLKGKLPPIIVRLLTAAVMFLVPLLTLLVSEWIVRQTLQMSVEQWVTEFSRQFLVNYLFLLAIYNVFFILPRKLYYTTSIIVTVAMIVFAIANRFTLEFRGAPITIDDFKLLDELRGFESPVDINYLMISILSLLFAFFYISLLYMIPKVKEWWILKVLIFAASGLFVYAMWFDEPISPMREAGMQKTMWRLDVGMRNNGILANFIYLAKTSEIAAPEAYNKEKVEDLNSKYEPEKNEPTDGPNVIYLMSESFIDPYFLGEDLYTEDPVPNFRELFNSTLHGKMYSPEFGGGTANVEFEALTGFSAQFMRTDHVAYQQFINEPIPSVPYLFKDAGYYTTAIHGYFSWYYQRTAIYRNLGFDHFIAGEFMDLDRPLAVGNGFPKDKHTTDSILETLSQTEGKDFIHAVSIEAHMPYNERGESDFIQEGVLSDKNKGELNAYLDRLHSVDQELGRLVEELEKSDEETILVFWGDHLPAFPDGNQLYGPEGTGLVEDMTGNYEDFITTHTVPFFIWSSESNEPQEMEITSSFIPTIVTEMAGIEGNAVTSMNRDIMEEGYTRIPFSEWPNQEEERSQLIKDLQIIQYDWLHGKRYSKEMTNDLNVSGNYSLGLYPEIEVLENPSDEQNYTWIVKGAPKHTTVFLNDQPFTSFGWERLEDGITKYTIPKDLANDGDEIRFTIFNSRDRALLSSETFEVK